MVAGRERVTHRVEAQGGPYTSPEIAVTGLVLFNTLPSRFPAALPPVTPAT